MQKVHSPFWPALSHLGFIKEAEDGMDVCVRPNHQGMGGNPRQVAVGIAGNFCP